VARTVHAGNPPRVSYALTQKGEALGPAIRELGAWAKRWKV
jgi:DNA-binding HxlR family transcriptional regulator